MAHCPGPSRPRIACCPLASRPRLPAAATTVIPACTARHAASVNGSVKNDSVAAAPTERLITRMLCFAAVRHRVVDRLDGGADRAAAGSVEHLQRQQARAWRDAGIGAGRIGAIAADDAGHVRAVTEVVIGRRASVDEVDRADEPRARVVGAGELEIAMRKNPRVDQGDTNSAAVPTPRRSCRIGFHARARSRPRRLTEGIPAVDPGARCGRRVGGERIQCAVRDYGNLRVE